MQPNISVKINGRPWRQVKSLAKSGPRGRQYVAKTIGNQTTIMFGDGVAGAELPTGSNLEATYRYGSGMSAVTLSYRLKVQPTQDQALWVAIRNRTHAIGFGRYQQFVNRLP
jgi:hypothetical protein